MVTKIENVSLSGLPFVISGKQFKLNYLDIGLFIAVKSGKSGTLKSLQLVLTEYPGIEKAIIYSQAKSGSEGKLHWVPTYRAGEMI